MSLIGLVLFLSGCTQLDQPIDSESTGFWNTVFVYPMSWLITFISRLFDNNFGLGIVLVTILVRTLLIPLNVKQLKSSEAMQEVQPEIKALQEKYKSKDQKTQLKLQEKQMELFQKHGVNPLAGCLPIFVQMPILISMYHAIMRTTEIKEGSFLWFQLGQSDPYFILPLLAGGATYLQQKLMMMAAPTSDNPQMKMMLYIMPIMITIFAMTFPSALALYWVVGNIFMVIQTLVIRRPFSKRKTQETSTGGDGK